MLLSNDRGRLWMKSYINPFPRATGRTVSIKCVAANPLNFEAREYLNSDDLGKCMYKEYSRLEYILQNPPYSEEKVLEYETRHSIRLPELSRTFLTKASKSLLNLETKIYDAWFPEEYHKDEKVHVVDIFHGRDEFLTMVIDGPHRGRVFDFHSSSGIGCTQDQVDFLLNGMTRNCCEYTSIMSRLFPGLKKY